MVTGEVAEPPRLLLTVTLPGLTGHGVRSVKVLPFSCRTPIIWPLDVTYAVSVAPLPDVVASTHSSLRLDRYSARWIRTESADAGGVAVGGCIVGVAACVGAAVGGALVGVVVEVGVALGAATVDVAVAVAVGAATVGEAVAVGVLVAGVAVAEGTVGVGVTELAPSENASVTAVNDEPPLGPPPAV